jgi:hypothetical protein
VFLVAVTEVKTILSTFIQSVPPSLFGPDKINYILENSDKLPADHKIVIRELINKFSPG